MDGREGGREGVDGTPVFGGQQGQADFAGREGNVGVGDAGREGDFGRREGVVRWEVDREGPEAVCFKGGVVSWLVWFGGGV